uniref:Uncharacterized protein n=1 Tax=Myoviridae sp. ct5ra14 TaxID=2827659 RepID=A0A8S5T2M2_9CAUD|nr:MAG TPA: hypothetical protein [Myoviridae sp. ct5ra14]
MKARIVLGIFGTKKNPANLRGLRNKSGARDWHHIFNTIQSDSFNGSV